MVERKEPDDDPGAEDHSCQGGPAGAGQREDKRDTASHGPRPDDGDALRQAPGRHGDRARAGASRSGERGGLEAIPGELILHDFDDFGIGIGNERVIVEPLGNLYGGVNTELLGNRGVALRSARG